MSDYKPNYMNCLSIKISTNEFLFLFEIEYHLFSLIKKSRVNKDTFQVLGNKLRL